MKYVDDSRLWQGQCFGQKYTEESYASSHLKILIDHLSANDVTSSPTKCSESRYDAHTVQGGLMRLRDQKVFGIKEYWKIWFFLL